MVYQSRVRVIQVVEGGPGRAARQFVIRGFDRDPLSEAVAETGSFEAKSNKGQSRSLLTSMRNGCFRSPGWRRSSVVCSMSANKRRGSVRSGGSSTATASASNKSVQAAEQDLQRDHT
jgi:hypothetical protein